MQPAAGAGCYTNGESREAYGECARSLRERLALPLLCSIVECSGPYGSLWQAGVAASSC